jgi:hypothetical protein
MRIVHRAASDATVKAHVNRIFGKLDLRDRVQAVVITQPSIWSIRNESEPLIA